jgi:hypothetical protein
VVTDIFTVHDYDQKVQTFRQPYAGVDSNQPENAFVRSPELSAPYQGRITTATGRKL